MIDLKLLGIQRLEHDSQTIKLDRRKAMALLAYVAMNPEPQGREALATLLWPETDMARALGYLRTAIWAVNKAVGSAWATVENDTVTINPQAFNLDVHAFTRLVQSCMDASDAVAPAVRVQTLSEAVALYRDDFMAGFTLPDSSAFDDWQVFVRESLRADYARALEQLVFHLAALGRYDDAIPHARRWLALDTLHEPAHRALMRLYAWTGQYAAAHRQFQEAQRLLQDELAVEVEAETVSLYEAIQSRNLAGPDGTTRRNMTIPRIRQLAENGTADSGESHEIKGNLPYLGTAFVGRGGEINEIIERLTSFDCRLLTLTGQGGVGKTRLALQAAHLFAQSDRYPDGVYFISLTPVNAISYLIPAIYQALPATESESADVRVRLIDFLIDKQILLVMDNFEHLVEGAPTLSDILATAPKVDMLVTSRERLNLQEEHLHETHGLTYPRSLDDPHWQETDAVNLFVSTARRVRPGFQLTDANSEAVVSICRQVYGMPLGIELAATWVQLLPPAEISREIAQNLDFLETDMRNMPQRHRSLRAVFEHSWRRIEPDEQTYFSKLALFAGAFPLDAARAVTGASPSVLLGLASKSLIRRNLDGRFEVHELVRQYAEHKLSPDDRPAAMAAFCDYYVAFLEAQQTIMLGDDPMPAIHAFYGALDNIRKAWHHAIDTEDWALLARMLNPLWVFLRVRHDYQVIESLFGCATETLGQRAQDDDQRLIYAKLLAMHAYGARPLRHIDDILRMADDALAILDDAPDSLDLIPALTAVANAINVTGQDLSKTHQVLQRAVKIAQDMSDRFWEGMALYSLGRSIHNDMRYVEVPPIMEFAERIMREINSVIGIMFVLQLKLEHLSTMGRIEDSEAVVAELRWFVEQVNDLHMSAQLKDYVSRFDNDAVDDTKMAQGLLEKMIPLYTTYKKQGTPAQLSWTAYHIGWSMLRLQRYGEADQYFLEAEQLAAEIGDREPLAWAVIHQAESAYLQGDYANGRALAQKAIDVVAGMRFPWVVSGSHYVSGLIALAEGNADESYRYFYDAVSIAYGVNSILQTLRHLSGLVMWYGEHGDITRAVQIGTMILNHRVADSTIRQQVLAVLEPLAETGDPAMIDAAERDGYAMNLHDAVALVMEPEAG